MSSNQSDATEGGELPGVLTWGGGFVLLLLALGALAEGTLLGVVGGLVLVGVALAVIPLTRTRLTDYVREARR